MNRRKKGKHHVTPLWKTPEKKGVPKETLQESINLSSKFGKIADETSSWEEESEFSEIESKLEDDVFLSKRVTCSGEKDGSSSTTETSSETGEKDGSSSITETSSETGRKDGSSSTTETSSETGEKDGSSSTTETSSETVILEDGFSSPETMRKKDAEIDEAFSVNSIINSGDFIDEDPLEDLGRHKNRIFHSTKIISEEMGPATPHLKERMDFFSLITPKDNALSHLRKLTSSSSLSLPETECENKSENTSRHCETNLEGRHKKRILHSTRIVSEKMGPVTPYLEERIDFISLNIPQDNEPPRRKSISSLTGSIPESESHPETECENSSKSSKTNLKGRHKKRIFHSTKIVPKKMGPATPYLEEPIDFLNLNIPEDNELCLRKHKYCSSLNIPKGNAPPHLRNRTNSSSSSITENESHSETEGENKSDNTSTYSRTSVETMKNPENEIFSSDNEEEMKEIMQYKEFLKTVPIDDLSLRKVTPKKVHKKSDKKLHKKSNKRLHSKKHKI